MFSHCMLSQATAPVCLHKQAVTAGFGSVYVQEFSLEEATIVFERSV